MFKMKHDIQINLKNEKEVFRLIRLLVFTFILSAALLGISDYIWNMTLYRISLWLVPWLVAIPAIINCVERKANLKELFGNHVILQIIVECYIQLEIWWCKSVGYCGVVEVCSRIQSIYTRSRSGRGIDISSGNYWSDRTIVRKKQMDSTIARKYTVCIISFVST